MSGTRAGRKDRPRAFCRACHAETVRDEDGGCMACRLLAADEARREARREAEAADRKRLGTRPSSKGPALVRLSLDAAEHWYAVAARAGVELPPDVLHHVAAARKALDR